MQYFLLLIKLKLRKIVYFSLFSDILFSSIPYYI